ncbi:Fic family protein [Leucobacter sp. NPDC077196]|uniref:Fic family protein n=1 Tax=Leucobacter sp. NPDC077196 TaxID=3154959 RepID=UPI003411FAB3
MGEYVERQWAPSSTFGLSRREQAGGQYLAFVPGLLGPQGPPISARTFSVVADAQSTVSRADGIIGESGLYLNHLLLRSESIASSLIEGHVISAKKLALADVLGRGKENAVAVLQNLRAMEYAIDVVAEKWDIELEDLVQLQQTIAPDLERGFRTQQNWIGGGYSPLTAAFVPPPESKVVPLLEDLLEYVNQSDHPPLLKAAIAHAQFETIHPFIDGNGRTGRALIHAILKRDGITDRAVLPISTVFSTAKDHYIAGLTAFREEPPNVDLWVQEFCQSAVRASGNVVLLKERADELDELLRERHHGWRSGQGIPAAPRADATVERVRRDLASQPVLTVAATAERYGVSRPAAERALTELADAGVLNVSKNHRGVRAAFVSDEHLHLVTLAERSNKAGGWDTADEATASRLALPESTLRWPPGDPMFHTQSRTGGYGDPRSPQPPPGPRY